VNGLIKKNKTQVNGLESSWTKDRRDYD